MEMMEIQAADITSLADYHRSEGCPQNGKPSSTARHNVEMIMGSC
jgi:hypothetical protein